MKRFRVSFANIFLVGGFLFCFACGTNADALKQHITCVREKAFIISQMEELQKKINSESPNPQDIILKLYSIENTLDKISKYEASRYFDYFDSFLNFLILNKEKICGLQDGSDSYEILYSRVWYQRNIPRAPKLTPKPYHCGIDSYCIGSSLIKPSKVK